MSLLRFVAALSLGALSIPAIAQTAPGPSLAINKDNRTLSISASDHAEADPDIADIHIGFIAYGQTLKTAYKTASDSSNAIVKSMLDAGAKSSDIQSQTQRIARLNDYEIKEQKGMRYSVHQSWTVSVAPKDAALILDAAVQSGANQSGEIIWRMKNSVVLEAEAIHRATERAHAMADEMARSLGVTLGKPIYATNRVEPDAVSSVYMNGFVGGLADKRAAAPLAIEAQRVDRTASVQILYALE